jgi:hypothetical protein
MTSPNIITPTIGDSIYLASLFANLHIHGILSDLDTPDQVSGSLEVDGPNMLLAIPVLQGRPGPAGTHAPIWDLQDQIFDDPADLPDNLTNEEIDIGKLYMVRQFDEDGNPVSTRAYLWMGTSWEWFVMGYAGPPGPVPIISWTVETLDPDDPGTVEEVVQGGDDYHPSLHIKIKGYRGEQGPSTNIADAPDVDFTTPPEDGDSLVYEGEWPDGNWVALPSATIRPLFYTVPQAAFTAVPLAFGTSVQILAWEVPETEWDVVVRVGGHMRIIGVDFDTDPFIIGAQCRLGHPTSGTLLARGFGNISTYVDLKPHGSTNLAPNDAITPGNGRGVIPANTTGNAATLYVSAFNDGIAGIYNFATEGAQLDVTLYPV